MFDFSKYNLGELVAISDMLDYIEHGGCVDYQQEKCREAIYENVNRQAMDQLQTFRESLVRAWLVEQAEEAEQV